MGVGKYNIAFKIMFKPCIISSVWQHIECMQVDPNNVPDKYMCEHCEPRPTDKKRARLMQMKKREDISGD